jgi:hypothetical protein
MLCTWPWPSSRWTFCTCPPAFRAPSSPGTRGSADPPGNNIFFMLCILGQCSGSMTFWCGSGSGSMPLTKGSGSRIRILLFSAYYFLKVHIHNFSKIKSPKKSQNGRNQCFSYYFCLLMEGSGSETDPIHTSDEWIRIRVAQKHVDPDPWDPYVFGSLGSVSMRYGSRCFDHQAKISRNTLIPPVL